MAAVWLRRFAAITFRGLFYGEDSRYTSNTLDGGFADPNLYELMDALCCLASITRQLSAPLRMLTLKMCVFSGTDRKPPWSGQPRRESPESDPRFRALVLGHSVDLGQRQRSLCTHAILSRT
jgi:hypothetical protein